jgi:hypothetical protein
MENVYEDNNNNHKSRACCTIIGFIDIIDSLYSVGLLTELHDAYVLIRRARLGGEGTKSPFLPPLIGSNSSSTCFNE